ncbi:arylsulfotransferase family protein [Aspergillus lucknowensis]|uniref:ASST-domain-containing protein n=1 Tax=Aspergillus lucknowensis TaxID=176173 RepID=A0ABR4LIN5_9EURO
MWRPLFLSATLLNFALAEIPYHQLDDVVQPWPSTKGYYSTAIVSPSVDIVSNGTGCKDGRYTFLSVRGEGMAARGPTILDQDGELVWTTPFDDVPVYNLDVNTYKGEDYLTFWAGDDQVDGHGDGVIYMLDSSYKEVYKIRGPKGRSADLHEFQITRDETALFTVYDIVGADLQSVNGTRRGWVWDGRFIEVDVETNKVIFEWRASEHVNFTEVNQSRNFAGESYETAWDFFHINSVDKDDMGNFLVTALYIDHLMYINGTTGDIIWRLGGKHSDFKDLSSNSASTFSWPHHARFHDNGTALTLFDNASPKDQTNRGLYLDVDQSNMTVKIRHEYPAHKRHLVVPQAQAQSQGSVQVLDNGNVLLSYGLNGAAWTEYDGGALRCHAEFGPRNHFGSGNPASYRVFKHSWKGHPSTTPDFEIVGSKAAVSWNGATGVVTWVLEGAGVALPDPNHKSNYDYTGDPESDDGDQEDDDGDAEGEGDDEGDDDDEHHKSKPKKLFTVITSKPKSGFETVIEIPPETNYPFLRLRALTASGAVLGTTAVLPYGPNFTPQPDPDEDLPPAPPSRSPAPFFAGIGVTLGLVLLIYLFRRCCIRPCLRRRWQYQYLLKHGRDDGELDGYYATEEQEAGLHHVSDTESDEGDDVEVSALENPRLTPVFVRTPSALSSLSSGIGGMERAKQ